MEYLKTSLVAAGNIALKQENNAKTNTRRDKEQNTQGIKWKSSDSWAHQAVFRIVWRLPMLIFKIDAGRLLYIFVTKKQQINRKNKLLKCSSTESVIILSTCRCLLSSY